MHDKKQFRTLWTSTEKVKKGRNNQRYQLTAGADHNSTQGVPAALKGAKFKRPRSRAKHDQQQHQKMTPDEFHAASGTQYGAELS